MTYSKTIAITVPAMLENIKIEMQLDTGCSLSLISELLHEEKFTHIPLQPTDVILFTNTRKKIRPLGQMKVTAKYNNTRYYAMSLLVKPSGSKPLLGRNWLHETQLLWHRIFDKTKEVIQLSFQM